MLFIKAKVTIVYLMGLVSKVNLDELSTKFLKTEFF